MLVLCQLGFIRVTNVNPLQLRFDWSSWSTRCNNTNMSYNIGSNGCGMCPSLTTESTLDCSIESIILNNQNLIHSCFFNISVLYSACNNAARTVSLQVMLQGK